MTIWDLVEKETQAKERGMSRAQAANYRDVQIAREIARELWESLGHYYMGAGISMDDVRRVLAERHPDIEVGNWAGSVFRGWKPVGVKQSDTPGRHRGLIRVWRMAA